MRSPILLIRELGVVFQDPEKGAERPIFAVDRVNLEIAEGSFTALVGESGSGKSVTALSICRLVRPYQTVGEVTYYSKDNKPVNLLHLPEAELVKIRGKEISYIFQDPGSSLNPVLKIGVQIDEVYLAHQNRDSREAKRKTLEMMESVNLKDTERVYHSYSHELSGGMKQRVMIAMALVSGPKLLIADEPTTALDTATESEIMDLLSKIQKERALSVLFITHNLSLATDFSDAIYVMQKGRVVEQLQKNEKFLARHEYTQKLFKASLSHLKPKTLIEI